MVTEMFKLFNVYEDIQFVKTTKSFHSVFDVLDGNNGFYRSTKTFYRSNSEDG